MCAYNLPYNLTTVGELLVQDNMTDYVIYISPDTSLREAYYLMHEAGFRHLPVVDNARLVGLISLGDLRAAGPVEADTSYLMDPHYLWDSATVECAMSNNVITVGPDLLIRDAAQTMLEYKIGSLPVVDVDGSLIGMITETDILRLVTASDD